MPTIPTPDPATLRQLLLIRPRFLGDVCLTLPALDAVRRSCPNARIAYVVEPEAAPLLEGDPRIDELIVVRRDLGARDALTLVRRLRALRADVAIDFFCNPRTALLTRLSGARIRVGYPNKGWRSWLYTHHSRPRTLSAVGFHLASLTALGWPASQSSPSLHVSGRARAEAETELARAGVTSEGVRVGFHPGARWETRRWKPERYAALARRFLDAYSEGVALVSGGAEERGLVEDIVNSLPAQRAIAVVGWPIGRFVALQSLCTAFVSGDTGPLHTAVAAGTPTLGLMSRNRPAMFFPYPESLGHRSYYARVECSPCHRDTCGDLRCLKRLTVDGAWAILSQMLARSIAGARA